MYIFELLYKTIVKIIQKKSDLPKEETETYEKCEHIFLPIDSTKKVLACSKCGLLIKSDTLKKQKHKKGFD